jgi:hypothetical protein
MELIDFAQDRCKRHGQTAFLAEKPKVGELQIDWLRSEDLKEEKDVTAPVVVLAEQGRLILGYPVLEHGQIYELGSLVRASSLLLIFLSQG